MRKRTWLVQERYSSNWESFNTCGIVRSAVDRAVDTSEHGDDTYRLTEKLKPLIEGLAFMIDRDSNICGSDVAKMFGVWRVVEQEVKVGDDQW